MKTVAVVALLLIATPFLHAQSSNPDSNFRIQIQTGQDGSPTFTITNLFNDTLTAFVIRFSLSSNPTWHSQLNWDTAVQDLPANRAGAEHPIQAGASKTMYLVKAVGELRPDKIDIVAAIWGDGETFGDEKWLRVLLKYRASLAAGYEEAIDVLQKGQDANWTRDEYLDAVSHETANRKSADVDGGPMSAIRDTMRGSSIFDATPLLLRHAVQRLQADFEQRLDLLRRTKPAFDRWS